MIRRTFLILTLIAVAAIILFARNRQSTLLETAATQPPDPGYYMTDAHIIQTAPDGLPLYRMTADRIQQDPENETIRIRHLELHYRVTAPGTPPRDWTLTARQGDMPQTATKIDLSGNVEMTGQPRPDTPSMRVRTQKISMNTQTNLVQTREPVDILWGESTLSGVNLTANLKTGDIKLESKVHGRYKQ